MCSQPLIRMCFHFPFFLTPPSSSTKYGQVSMVSHHLGISVSLTFQILYLQIFLRFPTSCLLLLLFSYPCALPVFTKPMSFSWSFISYFKIHSVALFCLKSKISSLYQYSSTRRGEQVGDICKLAEILLVQYKELAYTTAVARAELASLKSVGKTGMTGWNFGHRQSYCVVSTPFVRLIKSAPILII